MDCRYSYSPDQRDIIANLDSKQELKLTDFVIRGLFHDLIKKRSTVNLQWKNDPEKNLSLLVPFGCSLSDLEAEAGKAIAAHKDELENPRFILGL